MPELKYIRPEQIIAYLEIRPLKRWGIERLKRSIEERGFLEGYPVSVVTYNGGYRLFDGRHRATAAQDLGLESIPAIVYEDLPEEDQWRHGFLANEANDALVPQTFVDHAELIWRRASTGQSQEQIASMLKWSRSQVAKYAQLEKIDKKAWEVIVPTFDDDWNDPKEPNGTSSVPNGTRHLFSEGLLRDIVSLTSSQQFDLVQSLIKGTRDKSKFKSDAERYQARNALLTEARRRLRDLPRSSLEQATTEIEKGRYDKEWLEHRTPGATFDKLLQGIVDAYQQTQQFQIYEGDFREELASVEENSIDVILADPPYSEEWLPLYADIAEMASRVLKHGGSLLLMSGQSYLPAVMEQITPHLAYHWCIAYLTPGGQAVQLWQREVNTFWKPVLWFVKGNYDGKWVGDVARSAVNDNDKRFHEWGQSESGMADLIERFTQPGDKILDPCMGAGTTGIAAIARTRKFVGVEVDHEKFEVARTRLLRLAEDLTIKKSA